MSLKAKLEAVIYAAEEPVTLAQLSALFADEALAWKAAQAAAAAGQPASGESVPLLNAEFSFEELEQLVPEEAVGIGSADTAVETAEGAVEAGGSVEAEGAVESGAETEAANAGEDGTAAAAEAQGDGEAEAKRLARMRDREVRTILRGLLDELIANYASDDRGIEIKEIAGGYRMATKPECHDAARMFVKSLKPALKLSLPALETLAVVAYKQPVTAPEVNEIRGVDSSGVFGSLLARKLIATAGRKQVIGRPILYKTTKEFLLRFGLKDVSELPSMEEFEKIAQLEFEETNAADETEAGRAQDDLSLEVDDDPDGAAEEGGESSGREMMEGSTGQNDETAATADSDAPSAAHAPGTTESIAGVSAMDAESTSAEAAPAAPSDLPEQAETETVHHE